MTFGLCLRTTSQPAAKEPGELAREPGWAQRRSLPQWRFRLTAGNRPAGACAAGKPYEVRVRVDDAFCKVNVRRKIASVVNSERAHSPDGRQRQAQFWRYWPSVQKD
jgi:hypothetical protein